MSDDLIIPGAGNNDDAPKPELHVDDDWKAQAQAEKEKLANEVEENADQANPHGLPPADIKTLVSQLVTQALMYMGAIPEPQTGRRIAHLELAQFNIDLLGVLEEKTKGNLDEEEEQLLTQAVTELRQSFTQLSQQVAAQQAAGGDLSGFTGGDDANAGGIITPD